MVLECSSALKGPFTALFAVRFCYGCCLNGPFQGRIVGGHGTQGFADFALGWWNEPFRLKDGLMRGTTGIANSATSSLARRANNLDPASASEGNHLPVECPVQTKRQRLGQCRLAFGGKP